MRRHYQALKATFTYLSLQAYAEQEVLDVTHALSFCRTSIDSVGVKNVPRRQAKWGRKMTLRR